MKIGLREQAYGVAVIGGCPLGAWEPWCTALETLAAAADIDVLKGPEELAAVAAQARERAQVDDAATRAKWALVGEWLEQLARLPLFDWRLLGLDASAIQESFDECRRVYAALGLAIPDATAFEIVDQFPPPFDDRPWNAFCPDPEDEKRFGIPAGIYLRADRMRPVRSQTLIAHELVHVIPGRTGGDYLAMGLEEGIAEILGNVVVSGRILPPNVADNDFALTLLGTAPSPSAEYLDHTRQAYALYAEAGIDGLVDLLVRGRPAIRRAEMALMNGEPLPVAGQPPEGTDAEFGRVRRLVMGALPSLIVDPLEYTIAVATSSGLTEADIARNTGYSKSVVADVLDGLSKRTAMVVVSDGKVEFANFELYRGQVTGTTSVGLRVSL